MILSGLPTSKQPPKKHIYKGSPKVTQRPRQLWPKLATEPGSVIHMGLVLPEWRRETEGVMEPGSTVLKNSWGQSIDGRVRCLSRKPEEGTLWDHGEGSFIRNRRTISKAAHLKGQSLFFSYTYGRFTLNAPFYDHEGQRMEWCTTERHLLHRIELRSWTQCSCHYWNKFGTSLGPSPFHHACGVHEASPFPGGLQTLKGYWGSRHHSFTTVVTDRCFCSTKELPTQAGGGTLTIPSGPHIERKPWSRRGLEKEVPGGGGVWERRVRAGCLQMAVMHCTNVWKTKGRG